MKRISFVALAAIVIATCAPSAQATGFEPLGVDGLRRITGFGFGQGYHSYPVNPALRQSYQRAQCRQLPVRPAPPYPCSPRAPEMRRAAGVARPGMVQYAAPQVMGPSVPLQPADAAADQTNSWDTDETKNDWNEIPEVDKKKPMKEDPAEDSPKRESLPQPEVDDKAKLPGDQLLDELESYFGDDVGPTPRSQQQSQMRRLPPVDEVQTSGQPSSSNTYVDPTGPPKPKEDEIWW